MERVVKQPAQSTDTARKISDSFLDLNKAGEENTALQGDANEADTSSPNTLKNEYERTDQQLKGWLWAGVVLALLGFGLWRWGPRERQVEMIPVAVRGYTFRQAGSVRGPDGRLWLWILADTAGQAHVLLSADHGRIWRARVLGVPIHRARALAFGWGTPGKGLIVGDSGWVRALTNVFDTPTQGQSRQVASFFGAALRSVALDTIGQKAVITASDGEVWATVDQGQSWTPKPLSASRLIRPDAGMVAAYWADRNSFLVASSRGVGEFRPASKATEITMVSWNRWAKEPLLDTLGALVFDQESNGILFITRSGRSLYSWGIQEQNFIAANHAPLRLFGPGVQPVALTFWPANRPDSALLLTHTAAGDQLQRIAIRPQLSRAIAQARISSQSQDVVATKPAAKLGNSLLANSRLPAGKARATTQTAKSSQGRAASAQKARKNDNTKQSSNRGNTPEQTSNSEPNNPAAQKELNYQQYPKPEDTKSTAPLTDEGWGDSKALSRSRSDSLKKQVKKQPARNSKKE
ncbi:hypothetical protein [uncultured Hymenobacter sp.]|uniref:hypothetical protein n=1 Tax=uncultured Hymenobacter sp. TaxID=170016 RepID=UPI0035C97FBA